MRVFPANKWGMQQQRLSRVDSAVRFGSVHSGLRDEEHADAVLEASGGITLENVREVAEAGVDEISVGALTHSAPRLDLSMLLEPLPA